MWKCRRCGGKILDTEYQRNYYEVKADGSCGEFIENSDWCQEIYRCTKCGIEFKHTLKVLNKMAKYEE